MEYHVISPTLEKVAESCTVPPGWIAYASDWLVDITRSSYYWLLLCITTIIKYLDWSKPINDWVLQSYIRFSRLHWPSSMSLPRLLQNSNLAFCTSSREWRIDLMHRKSVLCWCLWMAQLTYIRPPYQRALPHNLPCFPHWESGHPMSSRDLDAEPAS